MLSTAASKPNCSSILQRDKRVSTVGAVRSLFAQNYSGLNLVKRVSSWVRKLFYYSLYCLSLIQRMPPDSIKLLEVLLKAGKYSLLSQTFIQNYGILLGQPTHHLKRKRGAAETIMEPSLMFMGWSHRWSATHPPSSLPIMLPIPITDIRKAVLVGVTPAHRVTAGRWA